MSQWRLWFNTANGVKPSVELVEAMDELDRRTIRRVRRLTRRGKVAANPCGARLAVALAHQTRQREPSASAYATLALMIAIFLGVFVVQAVGDEIDAFGIVLGACGLWCTAFTVQGRIRIRNAVTAERLNLEVLEATPEPYSPLWSAVQIEVPPVALVAIAVFMFFAYGLPFGLMQLAGPDAAHSASTVIAKGAFFGVFMTLFQLTMGRNLTERRSEQKLEPAFRATDTRQRAW
jgi:hypothetical protein